MSNYGEWRCKKCNHLMRKDEEYVKVIVWGIIVPKRLCKKCYLEESKKKQLEEESDE